MAINELCEVCKLRERDYYLNSLESVIDHHKKEVKSKLENEGINRTDAIEKRAEYLFENFKSKKDLFDNKPWKDDKTPWEKRFGSALYELATIIEDPDSFRKVRESIAKGFDLNFAGYGLYGSAISESRYYLCNKLGLRDNIKEFIKRHKINLASAEIMYQLRIETNYSGDSIDSLIKEDIENSDVKRAAEYSSYLSPELRMIASKYLIPRIDAEIKIIKDKKKQVQKEFQEKIKFMEELKNQLFI